MVVVDNSTTGATKELMAAQYPEILYIRYDGPLGSLPVQRNIGMQACPTDIICFTDDDGYADRNWLAEVLSTYAGQADAGAVGGRILQGEAATTKDPTAVGRYSPTRWSHGTFNMDLDEVASVATLQGTNMTFRRNLLQQKGGFDEVLAHGYASFEDTDACLSIEGAGYKVFYNSRAIVTHGLEPREKGLPRDLGASPRLAFSFARNGAYVHLKHRGRRLKDVAALVAAVPLINIMRCIWPNTRNGRKIRATPSRIGAAAAVASGILAGVVCWVKVRISRV